ncbi:MAG: energy transducer TonB [Chitinophagaceae bacterium]|nr:energy transducer TonB [Chitinophagaceae bacterium]
MQSMITAVLILFCCKLSAQNADSTKLPSTVQIDSVYEKVDVEAQFPGGEKKWSKHLMSLINKNIENLTNDKNSRGLCTLKFIVDTSGEVSAVRVLTLEGSVLAGITSNSILNGPKWIPATINGKNVKSIRQVKVTFLTD